MPDMNLAERLELTRLTVALLDSWGIEASSQISLLGLPAETRPREMRRYRDSTPFPEIPGLYERIDHFVGIADALRTSYPHNTYMANLWLNSRNHRFDDRTPLACMLEDGLAGILAVRTHLDCSYDWDISGSSSTPG